MFSVNSTVASSINFSHRLDAQARLDDRSNRDLRAQYRFRYYPTIHFGNDNTWSLNSFVVTGDRFSSSHNVIDGGEANHLYVRRLFARYENQDGKVELGVIPTYKGRVSSSGLSSFGWIKGVRGVRQLASDTAIELVVGQLDDINAKNALELPRDIDYAELEYSTGIGEDQSFEVSLEYMTNNSYLRGEYRWRVAEHQTWFLEAIRQKDQSSTKLVAGISGEFFVEQYPVEYFAHYSYVSERFGLRAELTEDFLGKGHGVSAEFSGSLHSQYSVEWFVRFDSADGVSRLLTGVKAPLFK